MRRAIRGQFSALASLWYAIRIVTHESLRQEEQELLALREEAGERKDVESWERYTEELNRVRRDVWEALRLPA
jgi:hypothetical protein